MKYPTVNAEKIAKTKIVVMQNKLILEQKNKRKAVAKPCFQCQLSHTNTHLSHFCQALFSFMDKKLWPVHLQVPKSLQIRKGKLLKISFGSRNK